MNRHATPPTNDITGMNPRVFAAALGGLAVIIALIFLANTVTTEYESSTFGRVSTECGSVFSPDDGYGGEPAEACADALGTTKAWTLPLGIGGLVVLVGALFVRSSPRPQPASDKES